MAHVALLLEELKLRIQNEDLPSWVISFAERIYKEAYKQGYKDAKLEETEDE